MLRDLRKQLNEKIIRKKVAEEATTRAKKDLEWTIARIALLTEAQELFLTAATETQSLVTGIISNVITSAITEVFGAGYEFKVEFVVRRNSTEADLLLIKNGHEVDPLGNSGLGVANIIAIAMRAAFIILDGKSERFLVLDEPTASLMVAKQHLAGEVMKTLCTEFGFQILCTTHSIELGECADKAYFVSMNTKGESKVILLDSPEDIKNYLER
jgi:DNA repair exonuclease SbcCD ATPase subunit